MTDQKAFTSSMVTVATPIPELVATLFRFIVFVMPLCLSSSAARADTAWISAGGAAHLMNESSGTVSMRREVVRMRIGWHVVHVDCTFLFENEGPACSVRMGFPDTTSIPYPSKHDRVRGNFLTYSRFVDGKKVATEIVEGSDADLKEMACVWHASNVDFAPGGTRIIREKYSLTSGLVEVSENRAMKTAIYLLHTGSSWRGNIGEADVYVTFDPGVVATPILVDVDTDFEKDTKSENTIQKFRRNTVFSNHTPTAEGRTLHYHFENFRPTVKDDIAVMYGPMKGVKAMNYTLGLHGRNCLRGVMPMGK